MSAKFLGTFSLSDLAVDLYADPQEYGGSFNFRPRPSSRPRVIIGLGSNQWEDVVQVLLHETMEFCAALQNFQYRPAGRIVDDLGDFLFVFNHAEFSRLCESQASFVAQVIPVLEVAFKRVQKKRKKLCPSV